MEFLSTLLYFLITIGVLVFVHELGHFLAAKFCKMRAEVFALGMGYRLFGYNKINGFTFGKLDDTIKLENNTDYRIAAFPIGGYVKIAGMIDESLDTEFANKEPEPWEFRARPLWQRMLVICAGVIMNILLAIVIFWGVNFFRGNTFMQTTEIGYVKDGSSAARMGFQKGDKIVTINEKKIEYWDGIQSALFIENIAKNLSIKIERGGTTETISIPKDSVPNIAEMNSAPLALYGIFPAHTQAMIADVIKDKPAKKSGLQKNDIVTVINNEIVYSEQQLVSIIKSNPSKEIQLTVQRDSITKIINVTPSEDGLIGVAIASKYNGPIVSVQYGFFESFPKGVKDVFNTSSLFIKSMWQVVRGEVAFSKSVGGPVKIAKLAGRSAEMGILNFLIFMSLLSISLAIINILPFPALDGGHLVLLIYEGIFRKPVPHKAQQIIQQVGMFILLAFMAFVLFNDIRGL